MFTRTTSDGQARTGNVTLGSNTIDTPAMLVNTRRGAPMHLTTDMIAQLEPPVQGMQLNSLQFMQHPDPQTVKDYGKGGHKYLGLEGYPLLAGVRDPTLQEYGVKPSNDKAVYITIHSGGFSASPANLAEAIEALQPEAYVTLTQEVSTSAKKKQVGISVTRTAQWLEEGLQQHKTKGLTAAVLAPVVGGGVPADRTKSASLAACHDSSLAGYSLAGFGTGEKRADRRPLLQAAIAALPSDKPKHIPGLGSFADVVEAVDAGCDVFDSSFLLPVTILGHAFTFPIPGEAPSTSGQISAKAAADHLDLWSTENRLDKRPMLPGCSCFACRNHTRAYLHHLLQCHEMLANVLLEAHNTHHALRFFAAIRQAITEGRWADFKAQSGAVLGAVGAADGAVVADGVAAAMEKVKPVKIDARGAE